MLVEYLDVIVINLLVNGIYSEILLLLIEFEM